MNFRKGIHLIKRNFNEEDILSKCKVLYYYHDMTGYVVGFKPTPKGAILCYPQYMDKDKLEKEYRIDEFVYLNNN